MRDNDKQDRPGKDSSGFASMLPRQIGKCSQVDSCKGSEFKDISALMKTEQERTMTVGQLNKNENQQCR